jgi:hypothetical protein
MAGLMFRCALASSWLPLLWLVSEACASDRVLHSGKIAAVEPDAEFHLKIRARAPGTSWDREERPAALLKIFVDDRYDQHVFLAGGSRDMDYGVLLGPLSRGEHRWRIDWDNSWTPALETPPEILAIDLAALNRADPAQEPILRAPILHIRKDTVGRFSDVPLVLYWELEKAEVTYTVIFSNEDGGTNTGRLMARWGRTTDIEWCYRYSTSLEETFQGRDHKALPFQGRKQGGHPILYNVTVNNNFSDASPDAPEIRVRPFPIFAALEGQARETMMDCLPWTYAVMAQEMARERKLEQPANPQTAAVSELRNYAYLEVCSLQRGTELYFQLQLRKGEGWFSSDHGDPKSAIGRSGCVRSTVELPAGTGPDDLRSFRIRCRQAPAQEGEPPVRSPATDIQSVRRLFFLDDQYQPGPNLLNVAPNRSLKPGQSLTIPITKSSAKPGYARKTCTMVIARSEVN